LSDVSVSGAIEKAQAERAERLQVDADSVLQRLAGIGFGTITATPVEVRALELTGRHIGMFIDRHEIKHGALSPTETRQRLAILLDIDEDPNDPAP
jgi:hypothetical protein